MIRDFDPWPPLALSLLVVFSPLPFGSVGVLSSRVLFVLVALISLGTWMRSDEKLVSRSAVLVAASLVSIAALGWLQSLFPPLPLLAEAGAPELPRRWLPGSVAPEVSGSTAVAWLAAAATILVAAEAGRRARGRRVILAGLVLSGLFQTLYGGGRWTGDSERIWGRLVPGDSGRFRGTFINPDHLAFFLGLILPAVLAWAWWSFRKNRRSGIERSLVAATPALLIWISLFLGLALTGSRAGLLIAVGVAGVQGFLIAHAEGRWRAGAIGLVFCSLGLLAIWWLSLEGQALGRLAGTSRYELQLNQRLAAYDAALDLWARAPLFGVGLGAFRQAFPIVQPPDLAGTWWHAHSDLLEIGVTLGLFGLVLSTIAIGVVVRSLLRGLKARRSEDRAAAVATIGAALAAGLHSGVDFSLTMPANSTLLCVLLGCGCAVGSARRIRTQPAAPPPESEKEPDVEAPSINVEELGTL